MSFLRRKKPSDWAVRISYCCKYCGEEFRYKDQQNSHQLNCPKKIKGGNK